MTLSRLAIRDPFFAIGQSRSRTIWDAAGSVSILNARSDVSASEQMKIEFAAPNYLRNIIVILSEMGLRYKKELLPMKKAQVDLDNAIVYIAESKTANGIGDMPMTPEARDAFRRQIEETPGSEYLFPSPKSTASQPYITNVRKGWAATLKKAGVRYRDRSKTARKEN
jgi:integrase